MNAVLRPAEFTRPADYTPHRFTVEEVFAMTRSGMFADARIELINGEIFDMPADGPLHVSWSAQLNWWINSALGLRYAIVPNATLRLGERDLPSPDWYVFPRSLPVATVGGGDVLLAIEQADTSLRRDLVLKAALYASHGVRDYWVIDLEAERVHVHRDPGPDGYGSVEVLERDQTAEALLIPGLALRLADLPRVGG